MKNGMTDYENKENIRSEFKEDAFLYLAGHQELYYSETKRGLKVFLSFMVVFILCGCVIGTVAAIYIFKNFLYGYSKTAAEGASIVASLLSAFAIQFWSYIYGLMSESLTNFENHRYVIIIMNIYDAFNNII